MNYAIYYCLFWVIFISACIQCVYKYIHACVWEHWCVEATNYLGCHFRHAVHHLWAGFLTVLKFKNQAYLSDQWVLSSHCGLGLWSNHVTRISLWFFGGKTDSQICKESTLPAKIVFHFWCHWNCVYVSLKIILL